ncbi:uncharacterized protein SPSK_06133 [Sporothrix schenckii 1099-18]|uniref:Uncharacterized protein n=2 Tax=Sporothrix schenckii TaxID=29908 RepID=U7PRH6_SPOS1|nr:uncharacterized protein SPSK_06133 [Sporothrix schenckii 1099-18]ERS98253.1 hypothetical protein HMPREF1624_05036 [Sporothrix schenckii ATCC 58251]KJR89639.1 hypothetical protein SPSK_06133 [Sporothrix schenckii 1099-18]
MDVKTLTAMRAYMNPELDALIFKEAALPLEGERPYRSVEDKLSSAFVPATLTAFTSRLRIPVGDKDGNFPSCVGHVDVYCVDEGNVDADNNESGKTASTGDNSDSDNQTTTIDDVIGPVVNSDEESAVTDSDDDEMKDQKPDDSSCAIANSDEDWEDETGMSYNADGTAIIKTAVAVRRGQVQIPSKYQRYIRSKKLAAEMDASRLYDSKGRLIIVGIPVKHARNPDGSLVSNLSVQLRRHAQETAAADADSRNNSLAGSASSSRRSSQAALAAPRGSPFGMGSEGGLPNPLRCHPGPVTPPLTPPFIGAQSPHEPPPVPPSTPHSLLATRYMSSTSRCNALTPPMSPSTAMVSMATAVATVLSSTSASSSINTVSGADSSSGSAPISAPGTAPSTSPETSSATTTHGGAIARIMGPAGSFQPFGNSSSLQAIINATGIMTIPGKHGITMRPALVRSASSHLLGAELSSSLHGHILEENNSRHRFNHYGPPRRRLTGSTQAGPSTGVPLTVIAKDEDVCVTALSPPPIHRTRSAPSVTQRTFHMHSLDDVYVGKGKGKAREHNGFRDQPSLPEVDLAAELAKDECYNFAHGYHAKGW